AQWPEGIPSAAVCLFSARRAAWIDVVGPAVDGDAHRLHALLGLVARAVADRDHLIADLGRILGKAGTDGRRGRRQFDPPDLALDVYVERGMRIADIDLPDDPLEFEEAVLGP